MGGVAAVSEPPHEPVDAVLIEAARHGNRDAFGRLVARYRGLVCSITYSVTGNLSHCDELAQETFLTVWRQLPELRRPDQFGSYLGRIARNLSVSFCRSPRGRIELGDRA